MLPYIHHVQQLYNMESAFMAELLDSYPMEMFLQSEPGKDAWGKLEQAYDYLQRVKGIIGIKGFSKRRKQNLYRRALGYYYASITYLIKQYVRNHPMGFFFMSHSMRNMHNPEAMQRLKENCKTPFLYPDVNIKNY